MLAPSDDMSTGNGPQLGGRAQTSEGHELRDVGLVGAPRFLIFNPNNGFLCWQREERKEGGSGFDGIELIGRYGGKEMEESIYRRAVFGEIE